MVQPFGIFGLGKQKSRIGIDIGTLSIKIVELSEENGRPKLQNYGVLTNYGLSAADLSPNPQGQKSQKAFGGEAVIMLKRLMKEAGILAGTINMSVPIFSSFLTSIEFPPMPESEIASAIQFEAKKYIPVSLESVVIDWILVDRMSGVPSGHLPQGDKSSVILIAIPKDLLNEYTNIARESGLKLSTIELETVSAARALIGNDPVPAILLDMGSRDTTISVVDGGFIRISHSIETSGEDLTRALANSLNINWLRAEELKKQNGIMMMDSNSQIANVLNPLLAVITKSIQNIADVYFGKTKKKIEKLIIYGGASKMPGFAEYLHGSLAIDVAVGNPFSRVAYDEKIKPLISEIGHEFAVATGLALKEFA
jgi:type IV pilus assembly protein PilM